MGGGFQEFWKIRARLLPFLSCQDSQRPSEGRVFSAHGAHQAMSNSQGKASCLGVRPVRPCSEGPEAWLNALCHCLAILNNF